MDVGMPSGAVPTNRSRSRSGTRDVQTGTTSERPTTEAVGSSLGATQTVQAVDFPDGQYTIGLHMENTGRPITRQDNLVQYTNDNNMVPEVSGEVAQNQRLTAVVAGSFGDSENPNERVPLFVMLSPRRTAGYMQMKV